MAAKSSLAEARATTERLLPGLVDDLIASGETVAERDERSLVPTWVRNDGPRLVSPKELGGLGATTVEAVQVHMAIGSISPALGAATTMHYLSAATLAVFAETADESERELIRQLIADRAVMASGFSEGRPGGSIFHPTMQAEKCAEGYRLTGRKAPCSLSESMDVIVGSAELTTGERAVTLIPADSANLTVHPFWRATALRGSESHRIELDGVVVAENLVVPSALEDVDGVTELLGFHWFGLLILGTYLGAANEFLRCVLAREGGIDPRGVVALSGFLQSVERSLLDIAGRLDDGPINPDDAAELLALREAFDECVDVLVGKAKLAAGGIAYMRNPDIGYLAEVCSIHRFHPPSMRDSGANLAAWLRDEREFRLV